MSLNMNLICLMVSPRRFDIPPLLVLGEAEMPVADLERYAADTGPRE